MGFHSVDLIECTPSAGSWIDCDLDSYIAGLPDDVVGVQLTILNLRTVSYDYTISVRKDGGSDDRYLGLYRNTQTVVSIGVSAAHVFEVKIADATYIDVFISGYYTGSDIVFFTNGVNKSTGTTGSFQDVDCTAIVSETAVGVFGQVVNNDTSYARAISLRKDGSSDDRYVSVQTSYGCYGFLIGLSDNMVFEQKIIDTDVDVYVTGYVEDTAAVFNTNASDYSLSEATAFYDLSALPEGAGAGIFEINASAPYAYSIRNTDFSVDTYKNVYQKSFVVVEGSVEGKIANVAVDFWLVGYFLADASTPLVALCDVLFI